MMTMRHVFLVAGAKMLTRHLALKAAIAAAAAGGGIARVSK